MRKTSELIEMGYREAATILAQQLHDNYEKQKMQQAREWMSIGATVNYSFYEMEKTFYDSTDVIKAFKDLGIDYKNIKGRKWYQFWLKDDSVRFMKAIIILQTKTPKS